MSDFNLHKWFKNQYLQENDDPKIGSELEAGLFGTGVAESEASNNLVPLILNAIDQVDETLHYGDFAKAIATIIKDDYGYHNFGKFMEVLHAELGIEESLNENEDLSSLDKFLKYFKSYDAYVEYIDDGGQYRRAKENNNAILGMYNALSPEDKKTAFKAVQDHTKDERTINAFK